MAFPPDRDRELMARIEARDADALGLLYDRHAARLLGLAERIVGSGGEAEEVLQEVFLYVWRAAASYDASRGGVLAWLLVATRSRSIDRLRARRPAARGELKRLDEVPEAVSPVNVESDSVAHQWEAICRSAVGELPAEQRRVLELAYFEGLTHVEIAERIHEPLGTAKSRIRLGMVKLREALATSGEGWAM